MICETSKFLHLSHIFFQNFSSFSYFRPQKKTKAQKSLNNSRFWRSMEKWGIRFCGQKFLLLQKSQKSAIYENCRIGYPKTAKIEKDEQKSPKYWSFENSELDTLKLPKSANLWEGGASRIFPGWSQGSKKDKKKKWRLKIWGLKIFKILWFINFRIISTKNLWKR